MRVSLPALIVCWSTRIEPVEFSLDSGPRGPGARRKSGDNRQEAVTSHRVHFKIGGGPNRGRTRHAAQQGDLAKPFARTERRNEATISDHIGAAIFDHIEAVAWITLSEHDVAGVHLNWLQAASELFDRGQW